MFWDEVLGLGIKNRETQAARYEVPALRALREANVVSDMPASITKVRIHASRIPVSQQNQWQQITTLPHEAQT